MKIKLYFLWLSLICVIVFILQNLPGIPGFTETFILNNQTLQGQIWRFATAIFLHGSISHLLYNLIALLFFGFILEKTIGSRRFLIVFFASGITANLIAVNFYDSSLGASGAIYGILGGITIINPMMIVWAFGLIMPMFIAAILWIAGDLLRIFGFFNPGNIGSIAHLSGIAVGLILGLYFKTLIKSPQKPKNEIKIPEDYIEGWERRYMK